MQFRSSLIRLSLLATLAAAVNIRNYNHAGCQGRYEQCSDINENVCCDRIAVGRNASRNSYSSSTFSNLPATALGLVCQSQSRYDHCSQVVDASWGDNACAGRGNDLAGSFWFTCHGCPWPTPTPGGNTTVVEDAVWAVLRVAHEQHVAGLVQADLVSIEGHLFPVNYGVPGDVTGEVYRVFDNDSLGLDDLPAHVRSYELVQKQSR
ncbi:hypothetical protein N7492_006305 [Penicillium capsulatum]|uniref:Uncharacterized protein n=1 Tax=Penicillium capsulatum TaxID=69766 RepID=A0A9W9I3U4_9EURO|nr:hypothetical protein N7492_006305 [Penicillium capsulatum]KAJ6108955.1 hypothetical protein N7512_008792 [Penicillium capsulatum]